MGSCLDLWWRFTQHFLVKHLKCCWRCFLSWRQFRCWGHFFLGRRGFTVMTHCGHSGPNVSDARANTHPLGAWSSRLSYALETHSTQLKKHALSAAGLWEPWTRRECLWWEGGAVSSEGGRRSAQVDGAVYHLPPPSEGRVLDIPDPFGVGLQRE